MNKFKALVYDSFLEMKSSWVIYLYIAVTLVVVLFFAFLSAMEINGKTILGEGLTPSETESNFLSGFFANFWDFVIFLMVFGSAWFIPAFLGKGRIELALSKPLSRPRLLMMKFGAVYLIQMAILTAMTLIVWLVISVRLSDFNPYVPLAFLFTFIDFAVVYSIVFFLGIISRSGLFAIMGYLALMIFSRLLAAREMLYAFSVDSTWKTIIDIIYYIMPKMREMSLNYYSLIFQKGLVKTTPYIQLLDFR
jgi:ABC-type transport system involved in multi-copper enzyme maturation permease subunit